MARIAMAALLAALWVSAALAQSSRINDRAAVFFDDSAVREIRLTFDDPDWYNKLVQAHQNAATTGDPYFPLVRRQFLKKAPLHPRRDQSWPQPLQ